MRRAARRTRLESASLDSASPDLAFCEASLMPAGDEKGQPVRRLIPLSLAAGFLVAVIAATVVWITRPTPPRPTGQVAQTLRKSAADVYCCVVNDLCRRAVL